MVELASVDGAIVLNNSANILAGRCPQTPEVLAPARIRGEQNQGRDRASHYGLALKVSSDGDITVYHNGKESFASRATFTAFTTRAG